MKMGKKIIFNRLKSKETSQFKRKMPLSLRKLPKRKPYRLLLKTKLTKSQSKKLRLSNRPPTR
jgi:hypothetical protein